MAFDIKDFVDNANDPKYASLYEAINNLVNRAGHVTIGELFTKSSADLGTDVWKPIQEAKRFGFLAMQNNSCCRSSKCQQSARGWCSTTSEGKCAAASDSCETAKQTKLSTKQIGWFEQTHAGVAEEQ